MSFEPSSAPLFQVPWFLGWSKKSPARSFVHSLVPWVVEKLSCSFVRPTPCASCLQLTPNDQNNKDVKVEVSPVRKLIVNVWHRSAEGF